MPKVKWGGDLTLEDIEGAEVRESQAYTGPVPPSGVYRFLHQSSKKENSEAGNPKLRTIWKLDGSWKPEHKKYHGAPLFIHMPVTKSAAWRVKQFCDAIGVSYADFLTKMVVDDQNYVNKIGRVEIDDELTVFINVRKGPDNNGNDRIEPLGGGYLPVDDAEDAAEEGDGDDADTEEDPF
jgi:hypothetical protein